MSARSFASSSDLPVELDASVRRDAVANDGGFALHAPVEQDREVIADVAAGGIAELPSAGARELELHFGRVGGRVRPATAFWISSPVMMARDCSA
jgi:hypothetical protein